MVMKPINTCKRLRLYYIIFIILYYIILRHVTSRHIILYYIILYYIILYYIIYATITNFVYQCTNKTHTHTHTRISFVPGPLTH